MNSRRSTIIFLSACVAGALALAFVIIWPFLQPFAFALILAVVFYPVHEAIARFTKLRPSLAALLSTLAVALVFGIPAFLIATIGANEAFTAAHYLTRRSAEEGGFVSFMTGLLSEPLHWIGRFVDVSKLDIHAIISSNAQKVSVALVSFGASIAGNLARFVIGALITFVIVFFLFRDGKGWAYRGGRLMPLSEAQVAELYQNISDTIIANVYGILSVGLAQGILTGMALRVVGFHSSFLLGVAAGVASIVPVVGTSLVWVPAAIYLLLQGAIWKGIFLLVAGGLVVSPIDNVIRPWVVGGRVELHSMVLLFFILGGVEAFGFLGLFLGPVVASVLAAVFAMLREELSGEAVPTSRGSAASP